jgi:phosphotriesterase-related protein
VPNAADTVQGVLGPLAADALGATQCHEHLSLDVTVAGNQFRFTDLDLMRSEVSAAASAGLRTIVDMGTDEHGRSPDFLRDLSTASGMQVIASTGLWREPFYPPSVAERSVDEIATRLIDDIRVGILGTEVRAGVIGEIGSEASGISPMQDKAFRACAAAAVETGVAIVTHTPEGIDALAQLDLIVGCGVRPERILIGHVDCADDLETHAEIARRGAFVGYDRVGNTAYQPEEVRLRLVLQMLERGYASQLILSLDLASSSRLQAGGQAGYAYLFDVFIPELRKSGVDEATVWQLMVANPARLLTGTTLPVPGS